jgi:hypothetical protein
MFYMRQANSTRHDLHTNNIYRVYLYLFILVHVSKNTDRTVIFRSFSISPVFRFLLGEQWGLITFHLVMFAALR